MSTSACYTVSGTYKDVHRSERPDLSLVYRMNAHQTGSRIDIDLGGLRAKRAEENPGSTVRRTEPDASPPDPRKRHPLGAGIHAAELG